MVDRAAVDDEHAPVPACVFCSIVEGSLDAAVVYEDEHTMAFLDIHPVFLGHTLVIPRAHHVTLPDLPPDLFVPVLGTAQRVARAVVAGLGAHGSFVGMNNIVSQSVPHLHLHVVPRRRKDGLRGFFWPRTRYADDEEMRATAQAIRGALEESG